jgi:hypothetical protein
MDNFSPAAQPTEAKACPGRWTFVAFDAARRPGVFILCRTRTTSMERFAKSATPDSGGLHGDDLPMTSRCFAQSSFADAFVKAYSTAGGFFEALRKTVVPPFSGSSDDMLARKQIS